MLRIDPYKARGIGGGGISLADKQALIQITNEAEANNETIKETMRQKLNAFDPSLNIPSGTVWNEIYNAFDPLQNAKNSLASNIAAKGVAAASGESLQSLANKVGQIIAGVQGQTGVTAIGTGPNMTVGGLSFTPNVVVAMYVDQYGGQSHFARASASISSNTFTINISNYSSTTADNRLALNTNGFTINHSADGGTLRWVALRI